MEITIKVRRPSRRIVAILTATLLFSIPAVALANHEFFDVANANPFHDDISKIAHAGVTAGFGDGGYHPAANVTRQSMAAFMSRGFGHLSIAGIFANAVDVNIGELQSGANTLVSQIDMVVPGATNPYSPHQYVYLQGHVILQDEMNAAAGCPCEFTAVIRDTATNLVANQYDTFESVATQDFAHNVVVDGVFDIPSGLRTFTLEVRLSKRASAANATSFAISTSSSFTAMTFPFNGAPTF
jgi:hypothetical protein